MYYKAVGKSQGGFTLVELMITVVVISLLAMVAIPAYNDSTRKARRSDAKSMLTTVAARQEQYFMDNKTYADGLDDLGYDNAENVSTDGHYMVRIEAGSASATGYVAEAQPVVEDPQCQQFTLDQNGTKGVEAGSSPVTSAPEWTADKCW